MKAEIKKRNNRLIIEFVLLFVALPVFLVYYRDLSLISVLLLAAFFCFMNLMFDRDFSKKQLWNTALPRKAILAGMIVAFIVSMILLIMIVFFVFPQSLFCMIREKPKLFGAIALLYPLVSVYPQELIYRAYFFQRYKSLFSNDKLMIAVSAVMFGFMHIVFQNWIAVFLTVIGGFIFSFTYSRTKSLFWVSLEHAAYGILIFGVGLGKYFWGGTVMVGLLLSKQ
jgi:membrane protease YdiL (CAAX protease family)